LAYDSARYYDPTLGRFISADSIIPGAGSLTVASNDPVAAGAWGQRSGGPANPQQLNRYSYVLNNPVQNVDPSGHCIGPVLVWCAIVVGEFVADVIIPAVVGSFVIAGAAQVGQQLGQSHAALPVGEDPSDSLEEARSIRGAPPGAGDSGGETAGKRITAKQRQDDLDANRATNSRGNYHCEYCVMRIRTHDTSMMIILFRKAMTVTQTLKIAVFSVKDVIVLHKRAGLHSQEVIGPPNTQNEICGRDKRGTP